MAEVSPVPVAVSKTNDSQIEIASLLQDFSQKILSVSGAKVRPWTQGSLARLQGLSPEVQNRVRKYIQFYIDLISSAQLELSMSPEDDINKLILEICAKNHDYVFSSDVYEKLDQDRVIEIYNLDNVQVYRSLNFFTFCSYDLSDLLSYEWFELYERSIQVISKLFEATEKLKQRSYTLEPLSLMDVPKHIMREKFSEERLAFFIEFEELYPVYNSSREICGMLATSTGQRVSMGESKLAFI